MGIQYDGERFLPEVCGGEMAIEHYQRYRFARLLVRDRTVLDAACGEGYGSSMLAEAAAAVTGMDIDEEVIRRAAGKYTDSHLSYVAASVDAMPFAASSFDVVVSFETIEHIKERQQELFLNEIVRVLKTDGILIMSTPNKAVYTDYVESENRFHVKEFYAEEYLSFLHRWFQHVEVYCQYPATGYFLTKEEEEVHFCKSKTAKEKSRYVIAVCSNKALPPESEHGGLHCFDDSMYYFLNARLHRMEREMAKTRKEAVLFESQQEKAIQLQKSYVQHLEKDLAALKWYTAKLEQDIEKQKQVIWDLREENEERKAYTEHLEQDIEEQKKAILDLRGENEERRVYTEHLERDINEQKKVILSLREENEERRAYTEHLEQDIRKLKIHTKPF